VRLALLPSIDSGLVAADVELKTEGNDEPWKLGELKFTLDEWTEFVSHFTSHPTEIGFDVVAEDERILL